MQQETDLFGFSIKTLSDRVKEKLNTPFEEECLEHYFKGSGKAKKLSPEVFKRLSDVVTKKQQKEGAPLAGASPVQIDGNPYFYKCISFYDTDEFDYSLGCATVYFDVDGNPVGVADKYDFDPAGHRNGIEEALVKLVSAMSALGLGKAYALEYGIHP
ncbi:MAG: hypothetical protein LBM62_03925 [Mediterranea sp.]|jgi:hypothetical protein|nr:hypothetical protein [Mediterranea sp.]